MMVCKVFIFFTVSKMRYIGAYVWMWHEDITKLHGFLIFDSISTFHFEQHRVHPSAAINIRRASLFETLPMEQERFVFHMPFSFYLMTILKFHCTTLWTIALLINMSGLLIASSHFVNLMANSIEWNSSVWI